MSYTWCIYISLVRHLKWVNLKSVKYSLPNMRMKNEILSQKTEKWNFEFSLMINFVMHHIEKCAQENGFHWYFFKNISHICYVLSSSHMAYQLSVIRYLSIRIFSRVIHPLPRRHSRGISFDAETVCKACALVTTIIIVSWHQVMTLYFVHFIRAGWEILYYIYRTTIRPVRRS